MKILSTRFTTRALVGGLSAWALVGCAPVQRWATGMLPQKPAGQPVALQPEAPAQAIPTEEPGNLPDEASANVPEPAESETVAAPEEFTGPATAEGFRAGEGSVPIPSTAKFESQESATVVSLRAKAEQRGSAYAWRQVADAYTEAGLYARAAEAYRREAALRRKEGDPNAAAVEEGKARRWETQALLYREVPVEASASDGAKWEPSAGCYIGAIAERDPRVRGDHRAFNELTGKTHSIFFDYRNYGVPFSDRWTRSLQSVGAAAQLAFEPNGGLDEVQDDNYLRNFARAAGAAGIPIFLRFAGEFNGDWVRYGGNPAKYVEKWRLVHRVMREEAPNVAMVWLPNVVPEEPIPAFYPGDDYVDWVGVNFYSVHHHNNSLEHPAEHENPADSLRWIYDRYSRKKPVMIGEFAATHYCRADDRQLPEFAADKLRALYSALPRLYPRVKAVHWYDIDNTTHQVRAGRDTNNFSLTDDETVLGAYRSAVRSPYFLPQVPQSGESLSTVRYNSLKPGTPLSGTVRLSAWVKSYVERPTVVYRLDGKPQVALNRLPYALEWDTTQVPNGPHTLEIRVLADGRVAHEERLKLTVANSRNRQWTPIHADEREDRRGLYSQ